MASSDAAECCPRFEPGPWDEAELDWKDKLSDENSLWGADVYISVGREVPGAENVAISGTFLSKVFEGPYQNVRKWIQEMNGFVASRGKQIKRLFCYYTTCPKCAKKYGKNYVVILVHV